MRVVVTGAAGLLGSNLVQRLLERGDSVVGVDNLSTGRQSNLVHFSEHPRFSFVSADVSEGLNVAGDVNAIAHLASPASPVDYHRLPLETLAAGSRGTENALRLAWQHNARFILASTSEVYGDPLVHPQREEYWGNVNPVGPRSVYDEAKRYAEALTAAYRATNDVNTGILRIFNTYGPRMRPDDGRVISTFIVSALIGAPLPIQGDGSQTRSFCYVDDLARAMMMMLDSREPGPINVGSDAEIAISDLAALVLELTGSDSALDYLPLPQDDPVRRRPDLARARELLHWQPLVDIDEGIIRTIRWFTDLSMHSVLSGGQRRFPSYSVERERVSALDPGRHRTVSKPVDGAGR
jgi:dTDP-glucose 4,6-dehydratase